jgi:hypothetical protein
MNDDNIPAPRLMVVASESQQDRHTYSLEGVDETEQENGIREASKLQASKSRKVRAMSWALI